MGRSSRRPPPPSALPLRSTGDAAPSTQDGAQEKVHWRRVALLFLLGVNYTMVAMNHALPSFHGFAPKFECTELYNATVAPAFMSTCSADCLHVFEGHDGAFTIAEEWQLVCARRPLLALAATLYYCGVTLGAAVVGVSADLWGRRPPLLAALYGHAALGVAIFFAHSLPLFMALRFLQGFCVQGLQGVTYTYLMEVFPTHWRTALAVVLEVYWAAGLALLAAADFLTPTWRHLQLAIAAPALLSFAYVGWVPESPRWLGVRGQHEEAAAAWAVLLPANKVPVLQDPDVEADEAKTNDAKVADITLTESPVAPANTDTDVPLTKETTATTPPLGNGSVFLELLRRRVLRKNLLIMMFTWFSVSLSYYGVTLYLPALAGQRHFNFALGAAVEAMAYAATFAVLTRFGRRRPLAAYVLLSGVLCSAVGAVTLLPAGSTTEAVRTTLTLLGKATLVSAFCSMFLYTTELFPTVLRAAAMGTCGFWSRVGSLTAPQLFLIGEYTSPLVPLVAMGIITLTAGASTVLLPETHGQPLPDTILEAQMLSRSKQARRHRNQQENQ